MLAEATQKILSQLYEFSSALGQERFTQSIPELSGSAIGQHTRHVLDFFDCLLEGYKTGIVNYDKRKHDIKIENDLSLSLSCLCEIKKAIPNLKGHKALELQCSYALSENDKPVFIRTTFERELTYNIEHAVHHMAIIKIGAMFIAPEIFIPADFGIAASTLKYQETNVHSNLPA